MMGNGVVLRIYFIMQTIVVIIHPKNNFKGKRGRIILTKI